MLVASATAAQPHKQVKHYRSGTGFFVHENGVVVTNEHVVQGCKSIDIQGDGTHAKAEIIGKDVKNDLALLEANVIPGALAVFRRANLPLQKNDRIVLVGYPGGQQLVTREGRFIAPTGPLGEPHWLQFSDSAAKGNSGGPLLDSSGQVIGVVVAKTKTFSFNEGRGRPEMIAQTDVAIQPSLIKRLMARHNIYPRESGSDIIFSANRVSTRARGFIVNIRCWR